MFLRANVGDLGARPVVGPFWESPDILLLADVDPAVAPPIPPELGQTAHAGQPTTLYAHVWNFGIAQAPNVVVEFYWCDPALGINAVGAHLIGVTVVALGARGSGRSHAVVKCPTPWYPTFVNGGHECLLVRVWDETSDGLGDPPWDASLNRHVGQRNIHVVAAGDQAMHAMVRLADQPLLLPAPVNLQVGPLFGEPAEVAVARAAPNEMPWLQLRTGIRGQFPAQAAPTGNVLLGTPTSVGGGPSTTGAATTHQVVGDDQQITFTTGDALPPPGQAHVYRVTASQQGQVFGGYTIVLLGLHGASRSCRPAGRTGEYDRVVETPGSGMGQGWYARVLIHCSAGRRRSAMLAYAVLRLRGRTAGEAAALVLRYRNEAQLVPAYVRSVEQWLARERPALS